jgi:hypothetical protein
MDVFMFFYKGGSKTGVATKKAISSTGDHVDIIDMQRY